MENGQHLTNGLGLVNGMDGPGASSLINGPKDSSGGLEAAAVAAVLGSPEKGIKDGYAPADRIKRKAKRLTKFLAKDVENGTPTVTSVRLLKNSRKPRNGWGRGLPKKGGAGGKGTWGTYTCDNGGEAALDYKDPNYDSESLENGDITLEAIIPEPTEEEIQKHVESIVLEYFEHGDPAEVTAALEELHIGQQQHKVIVIAVEAAMDHKPSHREMTSVLISELSEELITPENVAKSFGVLLDNLSDLILDTPDAPTVLGNFIARAVADDCLAMSVVHSWKDLANKNEHVKAALEQAEILLVDKIGMLRLNNVWGVGGGAQPVKALTRQIHLLLEEYLSSHDTTEASRCLKELEVPHFHHELVFEAIVMAVERINEQVEENICRLLKYLFNTCVVTPDQMQRGFYRVYEDLPDICIDVPAAYQLTDRFVEKAQRHGFVTEEIVRQMPVRGRKRFVSEGDGGKLKEGNI